MSETITNINKLIDRLNALFREYMKLQPVLDAEKDLSFQDPEKNPSEDKSRKIKEEALLCCRELAGSLDLKRTFEQNRSSIEEQIIKKVEQFFQTRKLGDTRKISPKNLENSLERFTGKDGNLSMNSLRRICFPSRSAYEYLLSFVNSKTDPLSARILFILKKAKDLLGINVLGQLRQDVGGNRYAEVYLRNVRQQFPQSRITELISVNPNYSSIFRELLNTKQRSSRITKGLVEAIPETYPDLFPLARQMQRHFILHIGPTNSGKSYEALEALKEADTGVYLAPLRLLAYEKYEELNEAGVFCSLKTGEEEILVPGAAIRSSTIEVLDFSKTYDVAVIAEAQMVSDSQRGNAWTMALLGVQADIIHVCLAPEAETVLLQIIRACDDTYEIVRHERLVPLITREYGKPVFPRHAQQGDAFIVFSRRDVHAAASELQRYGHKCSVIYGNLPYDVRRGEVKRYISGETDVVVATDAIGMGLNLPIKRIVFLEMEKYDGTDDRQLFPSEIRQIAGRAGRFGIFSEGIVTSDTDFSYMEAAVHETPSQIRKARIGFPYSLIGIEGFVSELMDRWSHIRPKPGFEVADMSREIELARILERETADKDLVYRFVMFPFDEKNEVLKTVWYDLFQAQLKGKDDHMKWLPTAPSRKSENLKELEEEFKICDMLYHYADTFTERSDVPEILLRKSQISSAIMQILSREKLETRTCKYCGKALPFHYPHGVCKECFSVKQHGRKHHRKHF